jgi:hypothetical protein
VCQKTEGNTLLRAALHGCSQQSWPLGRLEMEGKENFVLNIFFHTV